MIKKEEIEILKKTIKYHKGLLSPQEMINGVAKIDEKSVHKLIVNNYLEEVPTHKNDRLYTFYRVTEKGLLKFEPWYKKCWFNIKKYLINIFVSAITAVIILLIKIVFFE